MLHPVDIKIRFTELTAVPIYAALTDTCQPIRKKLFFRGHVIIFSRGFELIISQVNHLADLLLIQYQLVSQVTVISAQLTANGGIKC